jgi:hypothetical protein
MSAREKEEALAYSQQYKGALPSIDLLNHYYGGAINQKTLKENNDYGLEMYGRAAKAADGTGLSTEGFIEAMKQTGIHGIRSETQALNMAQTQALWSRFTGTDISTILKYAGHSYRYGGETGATAYGGLQAQNMGKPQFAEFLNSMQRIMEEGIAKGFVKSTSEIADNMVMLYKLSGNSPLWQGEQGARRLSQMNAAVANATNLQSVEDVISFGAARDILDSYDTPEAKKAFMETGPDGNETGRKHTGTYVDAMQLIEGGISPELLAGQWKAVQGLEGGNVAGMIERFKNMYGLNYTGGAQVWAIFDDAWDKGNNTWKAGKSPEQLAADIEEMREAPKYLSDSALFQKTMNDLSTNGIKIGSVKFGEVEMTLLNSQLGVQQRILEKLTGEKTATRQNIEALAETYSPSIYDMFGGGAGANFNIGIQEFSAAEHRTNAPNAQAAAGRFNRDILGRLLAQGTEPSPEILQIISEVNDTYYARSNRPFLNYRSGELTEEGSIKMNAIMDRLIEALNRNTRATNDNTDTDRDLTVSATIEG